LYDKHYYIYVSIFYINDQYIRMKEKKSFYQNKLHVIVWLLYFAYEQITIFSLQLRPYNLLAEAIHLIVHISFFYFHALWILPFILKHKKRLLWGIFIFLLLLLVYIYTQYLVDKFFILIHYIIASKPFVFNYKVIIANLFRCIYFIGFSTGFYYVKKYIAEREKTKLLEVQNLLSVIKEQHIAHELANTQLAYLKAQINPHFLFNTLSFVYNKVNDQSSLAGETIIRLTEMMRYAMGAKNQNEFQNLNEEIVQVENLIFLHKVRIDGVRELYFEYAPEVRSISFIPLVLLTLAENIFKHGDLSDPENPAIFKIGIENNSFYITTSNLVYQNKKAISHNTGLANIQSRLHAAYGNNVTFCSGLSDSNTYITTIRVPLAILTVPVLPGDDSASVDK